MDVIALVGPSGTGKSHRALWVAQQNGADAIIDDGILIKDGKVIGGSSAKKEKNRIMAVRSSFCRGMPPTCGVRSQNLSRVGFSCSVRRKTWCKRSQRHCASGL